MSRTPRRPSAGGAGLIDGCGAQPHPPQHRCLVGSGRPASVKTMSSSGGVSIGRSCAIGLRRSITSSTRRSAASAKAAASGGGATRKRRGGATGAERRSEAAHGPHVAGVRVARRALGVLPRKRAPTAERGRRACGRTDRDVERRWFVVDDGRGERARFEGDLRCGQRTSPAIDQRSGGVCWRGTDTFMISWFAGPTRTRDARRTESAVTVSGVRRASTSTPRGG